MKKGIALFTAMLLLLSSLGSLAETLDVSRFRDLDPEKLAQAMAASDQAVSPSSDRAAYTLLVKGSKGEAVKALQTQLILLGYMSGSADGIYGSGTASAVEKYQADAGLAKTGTADAVTQLRMFAEEAPAIPDVAVYSVKFQGKASAEPEVFVRFVNNGSDAIKGFQFYIECYDANGTRIRAQGQYDRYNCSMDSALKSGKKTSSKCYWKLEGCKGTSYIRIAVHQYTAKDGTVVDIPAEELYWQSFNR